VAHAYRHFESLHRCTVCGKGQLVSLFPPDIAKCADPECGVILRQTRPTLEDIREAHEALFNSARHRTAEEQERDWERHKKNLRQVQNIMGPQQEAGRILLDIGTGRGDFLELAQQGGWLVVGTELSAEIARAVHAQRGIEILAGPLAEIPFSGRTFDAITLWDVLDYVPDPGATLRLIKRLLRPRGTLFLTVANADAPLLQHKLKPAATGPAPLGELAPGENSRLTHFEAKTLRNALKLAGYEVKDFVGEGKPTTGGWLGGGLMKNVLKLGAGVDLSPTLHVVAVIDHNPVQKPQDYE
jgi:2-polyprenyl-3-methyl-5-hydroxy-6-metoxy-1,4-benzoquinol methylase